MSGHHQFRRCRRAGAAIAARHLRRWIGGYFRRQPDADQLLRTIPDAIPGVLLGVPAPIANPDEKRELYMKTGAIAVDMESHIVAAVGLAHELPVAAIRVITDPAKRALPASAVAAMRPNGTTNIVAMLRSVVRRPKELPALFQTALDARAARATLVRGRHLLGPAFTLPSTT
jgi:adenosylhomocysteine nucleosidase